MLRKKTNGVAGRPRTESTLAAAATKSVDRRGFLKGSGLAIGGLAALGATGGTVTRAVADGAASGAVEAPRPGTVVAELVERLLELSEIEELHSVAGTYSYFAKVRVSSPEELDEFLDRLMMMEGVERTETTMVLRTSAERPVPLPFEAAAETPAGGAS